MATNTKSERKNETRSSKNEQRAHYASRRQERAAPYQSQPNQYRRDWRTQPPPPGAQPQTAAPRPALGGATLNAGLGQVLAEAHQANLVQFPRPVVARPNQHPNSLAKWCAYHRTTGHETDNCVTLFKEVERLIKARHLTKFSKEKVSNPATGGFDLEDGRSWSVTL